MPITDDVRKYGETVLEQGKVALDEVRKPWYAAVGAGDLAVGQLQAQLSQLPTEVQARVRKLQTAQLDPTAVRSAVESAAGQATTTYEAYAAHAREAYETLAHRGELVVRRLRRSPEVKETFDKAEELLADAGKTVATAEEKVTQPGRPTTRQPAEARTADAKTAPARKAPAKRAPKN